jgi:hypothetical protein
MSEFIRQQRPTKDYGKKEHKKLKLAVLRRGKYKSVSHFFREKAKEYIKSKQVNPSHPGYGRKLKSNFPRMKEEKLAGFWFLVGIWHCKAGTV